jgi:type II secretory pathway component PulF
VIGCVFAACLFFPMLNLLSKWIGALRRLRETLLVRLPVAGAICRPLALSRLCGAIAILMKAGRPFHEAVAAAGPLTGYTPYADAAQRAAEQLKAGANQADAFTGVRLFPASFRFILASAQQRGDIPEAFAQLSELYQAESEGRGRIVALLAPPAFLILVGCVIGVAMFGILNPLIMIMERIGR